MTGFSTAIWISRTFTPKTALFTVTATSGTQSRPNSIDMRHCPVENASEPILEWQKPRCYNGSMTHPTRCLRHLSDDELLLEVKTLAARERDATAQLVASIAELDARRLYLGEGYSSLFT